MVNMLSPGEKDRIEEAVREAEARSRAEIVCVVTDEAGDYRDVPLLWAAVLVIAAPAIPLALAGLSVYLANVFHGWSFEGRAYSSSAPLVAIAYFASLQLFAFLCITALVAIPPVRRALTPGWIRQPRVRQRALELFLAKGLTHTTDRTAILLYISLRERCAEIVADVGINQRVGPSGWAAIVRSLARDMKRGDPVEGIVEAIEACSDAVDKYFPSDAPAKGELPNAVVELPHSSAALEQTLERGESN